MYYLHVGHALLAAERSKFKRKSIMNEHEKKLHIKIESTRGAKEFTFPDDTRIAGVIAVAVEAFGFTPSDRFELVLASEPGEPLKPERTLESYHIKDGAVLILTAIGGGV